MKRNIFFMLIMLCLSSVPGAEEQQIATGAIDAVRNKIALEVQMEEKLTVLLKSYLKTDEVSVMVKLNLLMTKPKEGGVAIRKWDTKEEMVLPGVPASTSMTKKGSPSEIGSTTKLLGISNISIWVLVAKNLSKEEETKVKEIITNSFDLNLEAGDTISIEKVKKSFLKSSIWRIDNIWIIIAFGFLIILTIFLYVPLRNFFQEFNNNLTAFIGRAASGGAGDSAAAKAEKSAEDAFSAEPDVSAAGRAPALASGSDGDIPLEKYVNKENVDDLKIILENEPPDVIAKVVQHLPPKIGLSVIPKHKVNEVAEQFLKREYHDPETVRKLLNGIRDKMAGSFGGAPRLARILQVMDKKTQKSIIAMVRSKNIAFAAEIESHFFKFTDLLSYDEAAIRRIFRKAGVEAFARCLKLIDEDMQKTFFEMLGPAIKDLITARMQSIMHVSDASDAELAILKSVQNLSSAGLILSLAEVKQMKVGKLNVPAPPVTSSPSP